MKSHYRFTMECLFSLSPHLPFLTSRLIIGIPQLILSISSLIFNLLLLITLLHSSPLHFSFQVRFTNSISGLKSGIRKLFQLHVVSLIISSLGFISVALLVFTPIALFDMKIDDPLLIILSTPDSLFYQVSPYVLTFFMYEFQRSR